MRSDRVHSGPDAERYERAALLSKTWGSQSSATIGSRALRNQTRSLVGSKDLFLAQQSSKHDQIRASSDQTRAARSSRRRTFDLFNDGRVTVTGGSALHYNTASGGGAVRMDSSHGGGGGIGAGPSSHGIGRPRMLAKTSVSPFAVESAPGGLSTPPGPTPAPGTGNAPGGRSVLRPNRAGNRHLPPAMRLDRSLLR